MSDKPQSTQIIYENKFFRQMKVEPFSDEPICTCGYIIHKLLIDQAYKDYGCPNCGTSFKEFIPVTQVFKRFQDEKVQY